MCRPSSATARGSGMRRGGSRGARYATSVTILSAWRPARRSARPRPGRPMPRRADLHRILIVGSGPIVIGQAAEFDYSGTQALKALREEGYEVILVNSNPATIMTDPELADRTYIEPVTPEIVEQIIAVEKPDAVLPTPGGQTGLNVGLALAAGGALERRTCQLIGA